MSSFQEASRVPYRKAQAYTHALLPNPQRNNNYWGKMFMLRLRQGWLRDLALKVLSNAQRTQMAEELSRQTYRI